MLNIILCQCIHSPTPYLLIQVIKIITNRHNPLLIQLRIEHLHMNIANKLALTQLCLSLVAVVTVTFL